MQKSSKVKVTMTAKLGRSYAGITGQSGPVVDALIKELDESVREQSVNQFFRLPAHRLAREIATRIDRELLTVGRTIAQQLIGHPTGSANSPGAAPITVSTLPGITIKWRRLTRRTIASKTHNKHRFFLHTGTLRQDILAKVGPSLVALNNRQTRGESKDVIYGPVRIRPYHFDANNKRLYKIAEVHIDLLAGARSDRITKLINRTSFQSENTEFDDIRYLGQRLGLSGDSITKLASPSVTHRPLLEPALAYYFNVRIPATVRKVIAKYSVRGEA